MFKILSEILLEMHDTQRWVATVILSVISTSCVKMLQKLEE